MFVVSLLCGFIRVSETNATQRLTRGAAPGNRTLRLTPLAETVHVRLYSRNGRRLKTHIESWSWPKLQCSQFYTSRALFRLVIATAHPTAAVRMGILNSSPQRYPTQRTPGRTRLHMLHTAGGGAWVFKAAESDLKGVPSHHSPLLRL